MRPEPHADFVDIVFAEPFWVRVTIPGHVAEDLIVAKPSLRSEVYVVILKGTFSLVPGTQEIDKLFAQVRIVRTPRLSEKNRVRNVTPFMVVYDEGVRSW